MNPTAVLIAVFGVGVMSGLRAFTPIALVSWMSLWGWTPLAGSPLWFVGTETFAIIASILALLELVGDKLPKTPARTHVMPLIARIVMGGMAAGALCFSAGCPWIAGGLLGGFGSVVGAFGGYYIRRGVVRTLHIPDLLVALLEDFFTIAGTLFLVHSFFHTTI